MAKQLQTSFIAAPGFYGLNTQDSGVSLDNGFALQADNTIIDKYGRLGSRKGWIYRTTQKGGVTDANVGVNLLGAHVSTDLAGAKTYFSWNATKFHTGYTNLVETAPSTTNTISAGNWTAATLNDRTYFFQLGYKPLVYTNESTAGEFKSVDTFTGNDGTAPLANIAMSAYGRLWAADTGGNKTTVYFSDLLDGSKWGSGSAGSINIVGTFAKNSDIITGLAAHNGFLVIFCKNSIMVFKDTDAFSGSFDVTTITLVETIDGIGCLSHKSIQNVGDDVLFLSATGIRSLGRTIQEKSQPLNNVSKNIRDDLMTLVENESDTSKIEAVYCPIFAFYLLLFPTTNLVYCFDTRTPLEDGSYRVTQWNDITHASFVYDTTDRKLLFAGTKGLAEYFGYQDDGESYTLNYFSNYFDLGSANTLKMVKKTATTLIAPANQVVISKIGYDYSTNYYTNTFTIGGTAANSFYGVSEYNIAEYTGGVGIVNVINANYGTPQELEERFETTIDGAAFSIQRLDVYVKLGKII